MNTKYKNKHAPHKGTCFLYSRNVYIPAICPGVETKIWAPWAMRKSKSRKPQSTLMHGIPLFFAVITSTSLSPM